ncbi:MAG: hypothetical protein V7605_494 [Acidimicrobiaceae bacterium]
MSEQTRAGMKRLAAGIVGVVATLWLGGAALAPAAVAQATVSEGDACPVAGNTAVSSTSGQALICTTMLDNGAGAGDLRWRVQTAANTPLDPVTSTTVAGDTTTTTTPAVTTPTTPPTTTAPMPTTGVDSGRWAGEAGILIATGGVLVAAGRRRRRRGFGVPA